MNLTKLNKFHKSKTGFLVFGIVELSLAYLIGSLAWNSGDWWEYLLALLLLVGGLQNLVKLIKKLFYGKL